jgi:pSer/pThr/pTyr-binding forkhead associated (FHA) protein
MKGPEAGDDKTQIKRPSKSLKKVPERFQASVAILEGYAEGMEYPIDKTYAVIGRDKDADVPVKDPLVSREHAVILYHEGNFLLKDLDSTNGTHMKGKPVKQTNLRHGDKFRVGDTVLQFILEDTGSGKVYEIKE